MNPSGLLTGLGRIYPTQKTGAEQFQSRGSALGFSLLDFWRWSVSDLISNATRGRLAEFIVARALGISTEGVRDEWAAYDLITPDGIKVEVKSAAYIQSWAQKRHSSISFLTPKTRSWDPDTNEVALEPNRAADIYVFALLAHKDKATVDPLDLTQWLFYVLPTTTINARTRSQHSISLKTLEILAGPPVTYEALRVVVRDLTSKGGGSSE